MGRKLSDWCTSKRPNDPQGGGEGLESREFHLLPAFSPRLDLLSPSYRREVIGLKCPSAGPARAEAIVQS